MMPFRYPPEPHIRRHGPRGYVGLLSFRPWLRDEFCFRCVYCLHREQWGRVKAGFALDHFLPVSVYPWHQGDYNNLLYSCSACNQSKGGMVLPDASNALVHASVFIDVDGRIEGTTPEAARIISQLGLDTVEETERRLLWIEIIHLAERHDSALYERLMGYPEELPDLRRLRPPGGNTRPEGIEDSAFARRERGTLPRTYQE